MDICRAAGVGWPHLPGVGVSSALPLAPVNLDGVAWTF